MALSAVELKSGVTFADERSSWGKHPPSRKFINNGKGEPIFPYPSLLWTRYSHYMIVTTKMTTTTIMFGVTIVTLRHKSHWKRDQNAILDARRSEQSHLLSHWPGDCSLWDTCRWAGRWLGSFQLLHIHVDNNQNTSNWKDMEIWVVI